MKLRKEAIDIVVEICDRYKNEPSPLMLILSDVQKEYGYIPLEVQEIISAKTGIPVSDIYGVVTFYNFFSLDDLRCLGACGIAPAVSINGKVYPKVTLAQVPQIIQEYREKSKEE